MYKRITVRAQNACIDGCLGLQQREREREITGTRYIMQQVLWTVPRPPAYNALYRCILLLSFGINSVSHHLSLASLYYLHAHNTYRIRESRLTCHFAAPRLTRRVFETIVLTFKIPYINTDYRLPFLFPFILFWQRIVFSKLTKLSPSFFPCQGKSWDREKRAGRYKPLRWDTRNPFWAKIIPFHYNSRSA